MAEIGESSTFVPTAEKSSRSARSADNPAHGHPGGRAGRRLGALLREIAGCTQCPSLAPHRQFAVASHGVARFGLMLIGEAPGRVSLEQGRPFSNPRSAIFRDALAALEHPRFRELEDLFYLTDLVKCHPAPAGRSTANRTPSTHEVATCVARFLTRELATVGPSRVIAVGRLATRHLLGRPVRMAAVHGLWCRHPAGFRVLPLMHPSPRNRRGLIQVGLPSPEAYRRYLTRVFRVLTRHVDGLFPECA